MQLTSGFLLGLGTGVVCLAYCGPVLVPFLMGEGKTVSGNVKSVVFFLSGRLIAYLLVGIASGFLGAILLQPSDKKIVFIGIIYILLAVLLIIYGFYRFREICLGRMRAPFKEKYGNRWPFIIPLAGGFVTGLNFCPPLLLAVTESAQTGNIANSILFFFLFFLGTAIYFIPLPFIGFFRRQQALRIIGKFAAILAGIIYLYKGIAMIA